MKPRAVLAALLVIVVASVCVSLGLWQLRRLAEKRGLNASLHAALRAPAVPLGDTFLPLDAVRDRRVTARGRYDETRQVVLAGRVRGGSPGVHVVTPLVLADSATAVLVDRGWLYAGDAATARPQEHPEPGERTVLGLAQALARGVGDRSPVSLEADTVTLWSARRLDLDSLAARFPYALAPYVLRQLPGAGVPAIPAREAPLPYDEMRHLSYAVQWFLFATILVVGSLILTRRRRPRADDDLDIPPVPGE